MPPKKRASASQVREELKEALARWGWSKSGIVGLCRGGGNSSKGSSYEREVCKRFSLWWTHGEREDIFWRSSGSGARAKVRGRAGRATAGQHGDMAITDPIGKPFIDMFCVEMKRGYSGSTFQDMVDCPVGGGVQTWEEFFAQTLESFEHAGAASWMLLVRRDRRQGLVFIPLRAYTELLNLGAFAAGHPVPFVQMRVPIRQCKGKPATVFDVCGMTLDDWLAGATPEAIKTYMELA